MISPLVAQFVATDRSGQLQGSVAAAPGGPPVLVREATPADLPAAHALVAAAGLPLDGLADAAWRGRGIGAARTTAALERIDVTGAPAALPAALQAAAELRDACPASAWALRGLWHAFRDGALAPGPASAG